jgi:sulfatase modifying factor 1
VVIAVAACAPLPDRQQAAPARDAAMAPIAAATVQIGDDQAPPDERPQTTRRIAAFLLDRTPVTVAQFRAFVAASGYVTDAERFGGGAVLDKAAGGWVREPGADWRRPTGPSGPLAADDHPVSQVFLRDAEAFWAAYGLRLPTEFEWERAARLGQTPDGHVFRAGDPLSFQGRWRANVWQGLFPLLDEGEDGYRGPSPVGAFGAAPSGLTDMAGNVWEWTASWYVPYGAHAAKGVERVQRGGSFLCDPSFCQGFRVTARGHATPDTSLMHVGFRCASDGERPPPRGGRLFTPIPGRTAQTARVQEAS